MIQGTAANITKESGIKIFEWIKSNNLLNIVKFVNQVHDENILEAPLNIADNVAKATKQAMIEAGEIYCQRVKLTVEPEINPIWQK